MIIHSIVYLILTVLTATAAYASSMPVKKEPGEQHAAELDKDSDETLQS